MDSSASETRDLLSTAIAKLHSEPPPTNVLPASETIEQARNKLATKLPADGIGLSETIRHLQEDLGPAFNGSSRSPNYYGFVMGGITPAASIADNFVTAYDQNVMVHLPKDTIATDVEDRALSLLCELLDLQPESWPHRIFTTGATASNVVGLACGREYIIAEASAHRTDAENSVGEYGVVEAMRRAGVDKIQILTTVPHSSLSKAASILGLGRASVKHVGREDASHKFDMKLLQSQLEQPSSASIIAVSASEVNTGLFATAGLEEMQELRKLCDMYGAWIHVDAAFGIMGRVLDSTRYPAITQSCAGLELADSITGDGHKLLNVPYDCGFFLSRHRNLAARVATSNGPSSIMSPLDAGIENSRRFRALPVYATLLAYGKSGYRSMLERQIGLCRGIAKFLLKSEEYELLPTSDASAEEILGGIYIIVIFRAKDEALNKVLVEKIKATRKIYVSGTAWGGRPACRFAVSNWQADANRDLPIITEILQAVVDQHQS
jgi:glutamate/tyrosine decarboxylase-like PLP-dependent enzyme